MQHSLRFCLPLFLLACGDDPSTSVPEIDAGVPVEIDAGSPYQTLIEAEWSLPEGQEGYVCATRTLTEDVYVHAIRPVAPNGTHHTVVTVGEPAGPDNPSFECGVEFGQFYASGVGTEALVLPDGVGLVAEAGQQVRLNLHLFNAGDGVLTGRSGIEIIPMAAAEVVHEARVSLHGPTNLDIPPTGEPVVVSGEEPLNAGRTIIALFPHMHQVGTHFTAEVVRGSELLSIWDEPYDFESQEFQLVDPLVAEPGDALRTTCTYVNDTGLPISWGDSSKAEMCFSIVMSY